MYVVGPFVFSLFLLCGSLRMLRSCLGIGIVRNMDSQRSGLLYPRSAAISAGVLLEAVDVVLGM